MTNTILTVAIMTLNAAGPASHASPQCAVPCFTWMKPNSQFGIFLDALLRCLMLGGKIILESDS